MEMHIAELILLSLIFLFLPMSAFSEAGIASKYHKDQGIADDDAVVFSENFERPLSAIFANWNGQSTSAVYHSSDIPTASGGSNSIRMEPVGISGTLYKPLDKNHNQLYFRYYVKFGGNGFHHTGGYIGGYDPLTNWPQGDAGLKGKRANGDRLFVIGFEERDGKYLDFYNNWIDMPGNSWGGMYYGRSLLKTESIPLIPDHWYCVELMVKVNSAPDVKDGELALWIDGKLIVHFRPGNPKGFWDPSGGWHTDANSPPFEGFLWRDSLAYGINWVKIQNYDAKPDVWFDDLVVATNYIGPINNELSKPAILGAERQSETVSAADFASSSSPTAGIQEAIDTLGKNGGVVTVPPGEYLLRQSIRVRSHVTLQGAGEKTVLRKVAQVGSRLAAPADAESRSVRVQDATGFQEGDEIGIFDQTTVGWLHAHAVVKGVQGNELLLDRRIGRAFDPAEGASVINYFPAITGSGLLSNVVLKDLTIDGRREENPGPFVVAPRAPGKPIDLGFTFAAINLVDVTDSRIEGCRIKEWPSDGISMQRGSGNLVTKCVVESCRGPGYHPGGGLHDSVFSDNESRGNLDDGFYFCARVERVVVRNNRFIGNQGNGVGGLGDSGDRDNIVENNLCEANGRSGIALWDGESNTVRSNTCINNSQSSPGHWSGITLARTERSVVSGNRCLDTQQSKTQKHGIEELSDCRANTITDNDCRGNAQSGLALAQTTAVSANDFLSSIGVVSAVSRRGEDLANTIKAAKYLGIRWSRSGYESRVPVADLIELHNQTGVCFSYGLLSSGTNIPRLLDGAGQLAEAGALIAIEGLNEPNNWGITYQDEKGGRDLSWLPVAKLQRDLYNAVKADPVLGGYPVWNLTESGAQTDNVGLQFLTIPDNADTLMPAGTKYADYANCHNYVTHPGWPGLHDNQTYVAADPTSACKVDGLYGNYGSTWRHHYRGYSESDLMTLPRVTTETGVKIRGAVTEEIQALFYLSVYLDQFKRGWRYTSIYLLRDRIDERGNQTFGFYRPDYTPRLAATYLHNLTTILADDADVPTPGNLNYSIPNQPETVHDLLLQKSDGKFELVVWDERLSGSDNVTVKLGATFVSVTIYDPTMGTSPIQNLSNVSSVELTLSNHPVIIEIPAK